MERLLETCAAKRYHPYFLGATERALSGALHNLRIRFPNLEIAGAQHGYYPRESEADVVAAIRASGADCLFIGMPTPHKERFLAAHRDTINVPFIMGVGGGIDIIAQITKRAPVWMQRIGLEWLYRIIQEPRRMWKPGQSGDGGQRAEVLNLSMSSDSREDNLDGMLALTK